MNGGGAPADAGEASSSARTALARFAPGEARPQRTSAAQAAPSQLHPSGPIVQLPQDRVAVAWWLARRAVEGNGDMPYAADGVLALWPDRRAETDRWTFGIEIEFTVADAHWVASELHARGLTASPEPAEYHGERSDGMWTVEQDRSVTSVFSGSAATYVVGGEVVSPPLRDTPEAWRQLATVLDVLRSCGAEVNRSCGLHVHVGSDALLEMPARGLPEEERQREMLPALSRLAMLASVCFEDLVFRMASGEGGQHRGQAFFYRHSRPLERPLQADYANVVALAEALGKEGAARRAALNLTNIGDPQKDTVEFRQCNGTLDGRIVQAFCRLCFALVGAARWNAPAARVEPQPLGSHWRQGEPASGRPGESATDDPAPLWRFLAAACPDGLPVEAAASLLWLYRRGTWQPSLATLASA